MERLRRILQGKWARRGMFLVAVFLVLFVLPVQRYRPYCGFYNHRPLDLEGPLRPEFADYMEREFKENDFFYLRIGDHLFVRLLYPLKWRANPPTYDSLDALAVNTEDKNYKSIFDPKTRWGKEPPDAVRHIFEEGLEFIQRYDKRREEAPGDVHYAWRNTARACYHKYAYVIAVETVPPEKRMQFLNEGGPHRPQPPNETDQEKGARP
jgi:hypothetical protein